MITFKHTGDFKKTEQFFTRAKQLAIHTILAKYGPEGCSVLSKATPKDTGITASSWDYTIEVNALGYSIVWNNSNTNNGVPIAILIQYGHGTGTGGYVPPKDYINPAMKPLFDKMSEEIRKEVSNL